MTGRVYLVRAGDFVKIGLSGNLRQRLAQIRSGRWNTPAGCDPSTATLLVAINGDDVTEALVHDVFRDLSIGHEWFRWDPRIAEWVRRRASADYRLVRDLPTDPAYWPGAVDGRKHLPHVSCTCGHVSKSNAGHVSHRNAKRCSASREAAKAERGPRK